MNVTVRELLELVQANSIIVSICSYIILSYVAQFFFIRGSLKKRGKYWNRSDAAVGFCILWIMSPVSILFTLIWKAISYNIEFEREKY